jgi:hypothetical protein
MRMRRRAGKGRKKSRGLACGQALMTVTTGIGGTLSG